MAAPLRPFIRQAGITLAEVCVVVAVLGVSAALALPNANPASVPVVDAAAGEIASALRFAQREAQRTQAWHVVRIDTAAQSLRVYRLTTSGTVAEDSSAPVLHPVDKQNYRIAFANGGRAGARITDVSFQYDKTGFMAYASFGPDGAPSDIDGRKAGDIHPLKTDGTITVGYGNVQRVVKVALGSGRITF